MSKTFVPIMVFATIFWLLIAFFNPIGGLTAAAWCTGCAWTGWIHDDRPTQEGSVDVG